MGRALGRLAAAGWLSALGLLGAGPSAAGAPASAPVVDYAPLPPRPAVAPVMACAALAKLDFSQVPDGPARVRSAVVEPAADGRAGFCRVEGYVAPTIAFELRLPTKTWTGRYLQGGCGGNCGVIMSGFAPVCDNLRAYGGDFAVGFEDSGHVGGDGVWALGGRRVREDFAFRAAHAFAAAAKAVIGAYYGRAPAFSYFQGCSDGGREAMEEAERYPADFNGVVAGAPAFAIAEAMERFVWEARWGRDAAGRLVLGPEAVGLLHAAVLRACDGLDGLEDGQIDDPRACRFDPAALACAPGQSKDQAPGGACLTPLQVEAARKLYQGPVDAQGRHLFYGGEPYGSELSWTERYALPVAGGAMFDDAVRDMIFQRQLPDSVTVRSWRFDLATFEALRRRGAIYDAQDADLRPFRDAGGKLILWQGFADPAAGPWGLPDYYARLGAAVGGLEAERRFARMFLIPGVYHCAGGYVPYEEDMLGAMVTWVETGAAPDQVLAAARLADGTVRRRPVYAYPVRAKYRGEGDPNAPESFVGAWPTGPLRDLYDWAGSAPR